MANESDNHRRTSRELFVSIRLRCRMRVRGGLGNNEPRYPSVPVECVNITYEINHKGSVRLADDPARVASITTTSVPSGVLAAVA
jgi:hypothetical protein